MKDLYLNSELDSFEQGALGCAVCHCEWDDNGMCRCSRLAEEDEAETEQEYLEWFKKERKLP